MITRYLLILFSLVVVTGCAVGSMPVWPEGVKDQYILDIKGLKYPQAMLNSITNLDEIPPMETVQYRCLKFKIVSNDPYMIEYQAQVEMKECQGLTGFKANDALKVFNWMDDMVHFLKDRKKCFK